MAERLAMDAVAAAAVAERKVADNGEALARHR